MSKEETAAVKRGPYRPNVDNAFTKLRIRIGLSQREFAKMLGIRHSDYHRIEHGVRPASFRVMTVIERRWSDHCAALGLEPKAFLDVYVHKPKSQTNP